jgi:uncharacterized protein YkwD
MNASLGRIVTVFFLCGVCLSGVISEEPKDKKQKAKFKLSDAEQEVLELTNAERKDNDLPPLKIGPLLTKVARAHSENMAKQGKMSHVLDGKNPAERVKAAGYLFRGLGENVGFGPRKPADMMKLWMESKHHRANILNKTFREIGIGIARDARGTPYYTQVFAVKR